MVFTALGLVGLLFIGSAFDEVSKYIISIVFVIVALLLLRHYLNYTTRNFFMLSLIGFVPYLLWFILAEHTGGATKYDSMDLLKLALPFGGVLLALDLAFHFMRNRL
ncbi:MAG: hypothetical protein GC191_17930 [Azospirillum sp.]|nr:hypothetical protein [Azospirillum sp.]